MINQPPVDRLANQRNSVPPPMAPNQDSARLNACAAELDEIADMLARRGVPVRRSQSLVVTLAGLLSELEHTRRLLTAAVYASPAGELALSDVDQFSGSVYRYVNAERGITVLSIQDISQSTGKRTCELCGRETASALSVCLQCGARDRRLNDHGSSEVPAMDRTAGWRPDTAEDAPPP